MAEPGGQWGRMPPRFWQISLPYLNRFSDLAPSLTGLVTEVEILPWKMLFYQSLSSPSINFLTVSRQIIPQLICFVL